MNSVVRHISKLYQQRPQMAAAACGMLALALLFALHSAMGYAASFHSLYIVPIWLATRLGGRVSGLILVVLATAASTFSDRVYGPTWALTAAAPDILIRFGSLGAIMLLIAQVEEALDRHQQLALKDPLTGLLNRRALTERAHDAVLRAYTLEQPLTVAVIDCDGFKQINDQYGHKIGDQVLQVLARVLEDGTRATDLVARFGGDEFVVILQGSDQVEAQQVMTRIQGEFSDAMRRQGYQTTLSVGLAALLREPRTLDELIESADGAMYSEKERKRLGVYLK